MHTRPMHSRFLRWLALAAMLALPVAAHAGRDEAETALTRASSGVDAAERAGALQSATVELGLARDQLLLATGLCDQRDWNDCERAAHRAHADARLAEARARQLRAEAATAAIEEAIDALRAELARQGV